ncbi:N6-hydroxylysine O-acetyltransferase [Marinobacterium lacunae]|uniref:N6-hydroxylysine O-acetyltransferase n=1 Tax=Marinobacterium lacunae TaxID=1232683 RepID=A0A081FVG2_9GAMM|nr:GNAT family N-acetyltransferase [Marinobacterium lacunae]KEA62517.1 N6-hydroxylysine O-acetyltransferase [Marinobacterium lacunae]
MNARLDTDRLATLISDSAVDNNTADADAVRPSGAAADPLLLQLDTSRFDTGDMASWRQIIEQACYHYPQARTFALEPSEAVDKQHAADLLLMFDTLDTAGHAITRLNLDQSRFWQTPSLWMAQETEHSRRSCSDEPPLTRRQPEGLLYRRYLPAQKKWMAIHAANLDDHVDLLHRWMNDDRVAHFWDMKGPRERHLRYLESCAEDPHLFSTIVTLNDRPIAYAEFYWASDDALADYYKADRFDRGLHCLIGDWRCRTTRMIQALLETCTHYVFLDDVRTQRIVGEPRADHSHYIERLLRLGFERIKEFDFPHKRAALMSCSRESFFSRFSG